MQRTIVAMLIVNAALAAGSILHASSGLPLSSDPYISTYALAYSYAHPPLTLSQFQSLSRGYETAGTSAPVVNDGASSFGDAFTATWDSENISNNQSTPKPTTVPPEPPTIPASPKLPLPVAAERARTSFLEQLKSSSTGVASPSQGSNELKYYRASIPITYTIPLPLASQYHQPHQHDHFGQPPSYGYVNEHSSKLSSELELFLQSDGITRGAYNYIDAEGKLQIASYEDVSDGQGFQVTETNPRQPVVAVEIATDSAKVTAAEAAHLQAQAVAVANVNRADATAVNGGTTNASGDNGAVVVGCNESCGADASRTPLNEM